MKDAPVKLYKARNGVHKFMAVFPDGPAVRFGLKGFSDYTIHKDMARMKRYIARHAGSANGLRSRRENWSRSGGTTAGFWSRWLLWSKPSFRAAIKQTEKVLGKKIVYIK
jgi:hypothetical protein